MGLIFTGGLETSELITGDLTAYAICAGGGVLIGVPTAETKGPPTGCPIAGAPYTPTLDGAVGGWLVDCLVDPSPEQFASPVIGP